MWLFRRRRRTDDDFHQEVEAHLEIEADRLIEQGLSPEDARHAAARAFGNATAARERFYLAQRAPWIGIVQDARVTGRAWRRQPGFAIAAILVLALGLGASTALFGALDRVLFRPLPYADPDRLVSVGLVLPGPGGSPMPEMMLDRSYVQLWSTPPAPFESVTTMAGSSSCDIAEAQPERVTCAYVEHNFLRVLGVRVAAGRDFTPEDDVRGTPPVALISHGVWARRYGADPDAIGRTMALDDARTLERVSIAGVLPPDFEMPLGAADILLPSQIRPLDPASGVIRFLEAFARLKPGTTLQEVEAALAPQLPAMLAITSPPGGSTGWRVRPLRDRQVGDASRVAWLLLGAVAILLLIACVNVVNLMLARVAARRQEFAVRAAIGGGRLRLARLALCEGGLLALAAGGLGLILAVALLKTFIAIAPAGIPGIAEASLDARVFAAAILLAAGAGAAIGLWPAFSVLRIGGLQALRSTRGTSAGAGPHARFALVAAQIALTVALLGGSALLLRTLWNLVALPLGFEADQVITLTVRLGAARYASPEQRGAFFDALLAEAQATPGAVSAALSDAPPPRGFLVMHPAIEVEGRPRPPGTTHPAIRLRSVTPQYFETFGMSAIGGRVFVDADRQEAVILSESAAGVLFGTRAATDQKIRIAPDSPWLTVVGVVQDVRNGPNVDDDPQPELYLVLPRGESRRGAAHLALRTTVPPADAEALLRRIAADLDPTLPVTIETGSQQVSRLTERPRFLAALLSAFAVLALALSAAGLYSVASYLVAQRTNEIGVRIALGAAPGDVARQVIREAVRWISAGALLGCMLGWMTSRMLQSHLYAIEALDPWAWMAALSALALALAVAVVRPALAAARVDPLAALRSE